MKEKDLLNWVLDLAQRTGWRAWHVPTPMLASRHGGFVAAKQAAGLPDLFLLCDDPPRMIIAELKGTNGKLTDAQQDFLKLARQVSDITTVNDDGVQIRRALAAYAWTPDNQTQIEAILTTKVLL